MLGNWKPKSSWLSYRNKNSDSDPSLVGLVGSSRLTVAESSATVAFTRPPARLSPASRVADSKLVAAAAVA